MNVPETGSRTPLPQIVKIYHNARVVENLTRNIFIGDNFIHLFLQLITADGRLFLVEKWVTGPLAPHLSISSPSLGPDGNPEALLDLAQSRYIGQVPKEGHEASIIGPWPETPEVDIIIRANAKINEVNAELMAAKEEHATAMAKLQAMEIRCRNLEVSASSLENRLANIKNHRNQIAAELTLAQEQLKNVWSRAANAEAEVRQLHEYIRLNNHRTSSVDNLGVNLHDGAARNAQASQEEPSESSSCPLSPAMSEQPRTSIQAVAMTTYSPRRR
jgi:DNA-binding protein H-NS